MATTLQYPASGNYELHIQAEDTCGNEKDEIRVVSVRDKYFTISYDSKGGSSFSPDRVIEGGFIRGFPLPEKDEYTFGGWYDNEFCYGDPIEEIDPVVRDMTLYARWTKEQTFTLTYEMEGGKPIGAEHYLPDVTVTLPHNPEYSDDSLDFDGWYLDSAYTGDPITSIVMDSDKTVYAKWTVGRTYVLGGNTLAINVRLRDKEAYIAQYGAVTAEYDPLDSAHPYVYANASDRPWNGRASTINKVVIANGIKPTSMAHWFEGFNANTSTMQFIDLDKIDTSVCTDMSYCFANMRMKSADVDVSKLDVSHTQNFSYMFYNSVVKSLDISAFNTSRATNMEAMFYGFGFDLSTTLATFDVSHFNVSNVTNFKDMFRGTGGIERLKLISSPASTGWDVSKGTDFTNMFRNSIRLERIFSKDFNFKTGAVTTDMFLTMDDIIGQEGTDYDASHTDGTYAVVDEGTTKPGYFTVEVKYTLTYDVGTYGEAIAPTKHVENTVATLPTPTSTDEDYTFEGWYLKADFTGDKVTTVTMDENKTVYAKWEYTIYGKHILFADNTLVLGVPEEREAEFITLHGSVRKRYENNPTSEVNATMPWVGDSSVTIKNVYCATNHTVLYPCYRAFSERTTLRDINLSGLMSDPTYGFGGAGQGFEYMFASSTGITNINLSGMRSNVDVSCRGMFYQTQISGSGAITLPNWQNDPVVKSIHNMFSETRVNTIDLSPLNLSRCTNFNYCVLQSTATSVDIGANFNPSSMITCSGFISENSYLTEIKNMDKFDMPASVTMCNELFRQNTAMVEYDIRGIKAIERPNLSSYDHLFRGCTALTTIWGDEWVIPTTATASNLFTGSSRLVGSNGTTYSSAIASNPSYGRVDGKDGLPGLFSKKPYIFDGGTYLFNDTTGSSYDKVLVLNLPEDQVASYVQQYGNWVSKYAPMDDNNPYEFARFQDVPWAVGDDIRNVTKLIIASEMKPTKMDYWFYRITAMPSERIKPTEVIGIENLDTSNCTSMVEAFCSFVANELDLTSLDVSKVTDFTRTFSYLITMDENGRGLDISTWGTSSATTMEEMFKRATVNCASNILDVSALDMSSVKKTKNMFTTLQAPTTIKLGTWDVRQVSDCDNMFSSMPNVTTIIGTAFTFDVVTTGASAFANSSKLVGGAGTRYNSSRTEITYARIDGGTSNPGYFTAP